MEPKRVDVAIIGAGAAGLMCAARVARRGRSVAVLERSEKIGLKILVSGGGRCNFTNTGAGPDAYVSANPHFCRSALARFTPEEFIRLVEKHGIAYHEKKLGQLFCDRSAREIVEMLLAECREAGADIVAGCDVSAVRKIAEPGEGPRFRVETGTGAFACRSLVIATGSPTLPKSGATPFGYEIARQFGLGVIEPEPALVPFTLEPGLMARLADLPGTSADAIVSCGGAVFRENILFTHKGLSGPAILQASLYWKPGTAVAIDLWPDRDLRAELLEEKRSGTRSELAGVLAERLTKRLAQALCALHETSGPLSRLPDARLEAFARKIQRWEVVPAGTEGYRTAEVARWGVDTRELSSRTMESGKVPGLHFIGEVVDVTGWLGGYNFQWAWASGAAAGDAV